MHDPGRPVGVGAADLVALLVGGIFEGDPTVAGLGQGPHHLAVELPGRDLPFVESGFLGGLVGLFELFAVEVDQVGDLLGIEQGPLPVLLDALHEQVGDPVGEVQVVGPAGVVAGVVTQLQEVLDVGMPGFEVHTRRTFATSALVDRRHRRVEGSEPGNDAVGEAVGSLDQAAGGAHPVPRHTDATGELREAGDVGVPLVDALEGVLG